MAQIPQLFISALRSTIYVKSSYSTKLVLKALNRHKRLHSTLTCVSSLLGGLFHTTEKKEDICLQVMFQQGASRRSISKFDETRAFFPIFTPLIEDKSKRQTANYVMIGSGLTTLLIGTTSILKRRATTNADILKDQSSGLVQI